ncbi:MAG TPA: hypothetical protein V6D05_11610 [Stenomitos sp.]
MRRVAGMMGMAAVMAGLAGCATVPATPTTALSAPRAPQAPLASATQALPEGPSQEATASILYRNPRYPLHSDRFEFRTGTFQPIDDGMGPRGDVSFFYDGAQFFVIANSSAGSDRGIAPQTDGSFRQGPFPLTPGARYRIKTPDGLAWLEIERLDPGTMQLTPQQGSGSGAVIFRYRLAG